MGMSRFTQLTSSLCVGTLLTQNRRGKSGGQVRDEYRQEYDPGRGGYGRNVGEYGGEDDDFR